VSLGWGSNTRESSPVKFVLYRIKEVWFNAQGIEGYFILDVDLSGSRMFLIPVGAIFWCLVPKLQLLTPLSALSSTEVNRNGKKGRKNFYPQFLELPFRNRASRRKKA
jgi:hypothetical protein